jgi:hypothetical protein
MNRHKRKTRKSRRFENLPLPAEDLDALLTVIEGELRGLILLTLLAGHPPSQTVRLKWKDVVPLVEQLASYFQTANQSRQPEALLFPELAKLPPHLLGASTNTRANRGQNLAALRRLFTRALSGAERQHSEISAKTEA